MTVFLDFLSRDLKRLFAVRKNQNFYSVRMNKIDGLFTFAERIRHIRLQVAQYSAVNKRRNENLLL